MDDYHLQSQMSKQLYQNYKPIKHKNNSKEITDLKMQAAHSSLNTNQIYLYTTKNLQEYQQYWEKSFLDRITNQVSSKEIDKNNNPKLMRYPPSEDKDQIYERRMQSKNRKKNKKQWSKYKAYAVKMKIPPNYQLIQLKQRDPRIGAASESKNKSQIRFKEQNRANYLKMQQIFRANVRDIAIANVFESSGVNIFKKRPNKSKKNTNIRKRSIKTCDKRKQEELQIKQSLNKFLKTSTSPKITKKYVLSLQRSTIQQKPIDKSDNYLRQQFRKNDEFKKNPLQIKTGDLRKLDSDISQRVNPILTKNMMKSPLKDKQKDLRPIFSRNKDPCKFDSQNSKFLQKVQHAIHFRKKQIRLQSQNGMNSIQVKSSQKYKPIQNEQDLGQASKTIIKTIYASKDVIRNKSNTKQSVIKQLQFNRKQSNNHKIFVFNSQDQYIRKILTKAGWIHNHDHRSQFYHLKWVFKPDSIDYHNLKPRQLVNHVRNSHQLTAKNYLNKNLKAFHSSWVSLYKFYPKCYDFAIPSDKQQFYAQFKKEIMMNLLRNIYQYFLTVQTAKVQNFTKLYMNLLETDGNYRISTKQTSVLYNRSFRKIDMEDYRNFNNLFVVHMNLLIIALKYWRWVRKSEQLQLDDEGHFLFFRDRQFEESIHHLQRYSKMKLPYSNQVESYFQMEYFATPSNIVIERVVKQYVYFQHHLGKQWSTFGKGNIWIVKPCSASRGNGIYLANDCSQILTDSRGIQSKIVQRYIERPLIFQSGSASGRKFDLRQWVLLRSVQPLQIYMFSHCYVRICSQAFDITNINNLKAHLTNYSFNKKHYRQPADSVIDQDEFEKILIRQKDINFSEVVRPKIKQIVINSIKSTQTLISDCGKRCFSLLGYDILLDQNCQPWLLQVNMSPACQERTEWLKCYLSIMGRQLLKIVLPESLANKQLSRNSSPSKANWSPVNWNIQDTDLNKIKTQVSQTKFQTSSYVNTIFQVFPNKKLQTNTDKIINDENDVQINEQYMDQQQKHDEDRYQDEKYQKLQIQEDQLSIHEQIINDQEIQLNHQNSAQDKFSNLQLYLNQAEQKSPNISSEIHKPLHTEIQSSPVSKMTSPSKSKELIQQQSPLLSHFQKILHWQKICYEEYIILKKDNDFQLEIVSSKIGPEKIASIDLYFDCLKNQQEQKLQNCEKIQTAIKKFLLFRRSRQIQTKQSLKINIQKINKDWQKERSRERETKSALYMRQQVNYTNLQRVESRQTIRELKIRPTTSRNKSKIVGDINFRDKIRSIASQAAAREIQKKSIEEVLEPKLVLDKINSEPSLNQKSEDELK